MREIKGDLWKIYERECRDSIDPNVNVIVIPTNGTVKKNFEAVMGAGLALDAVKQWPNLPTLLGGRLRVIGNVLHIFSIYHIITFPVKHQWFEKADIELIRQSASELALMTIKLRYKKIYLPRVGCGNGRLDWENVRPILKKILVGHNFIVVHNEKTI